ncbi:transposase-like protein [Pseudomonas frederiksbergensis]
MISMEMMGKIRRMYFRDKLSLHEIAKRTGLSRNIIRKWVREPEATQPAYHRCVSFNKLSPYQQTLEQALKADSLGKAQSQGRQSTLRTDQGRGLRRRLQPAHHLHTLMAR